MRALLFLHFAKIPENLLSKKIHVVEHFSPGLQLWRIVVYLIGNM